MAKSEVYSWRLDPDTKMALETEARRQGRSLAELLDHIAQQWLSDGTRKNDDEEQARINAAVAKCFGSISAGPEFSENVREKVRKRVKDRHESKRSA